MLHTGFTGLATQKRSGTIDPLSGHADPQFIPSYVVFYIGHARIPILPLIDRKRRNRRPCICVQCDKPLDLRLSRLLKLHPVFLSRPGFLKSIAQIRENSKKLHRFFAYILHFLAAFSII